MSARPRFIFLDVLRGIAVLWMIQVHITNQIIDPVLRSTPFFHWLNISNGFVAPCFIFCAGAGLWIAFQRKAAEFRSFGKPFRDYLRRLAYILFWAYALHVPFYSLDRMLIATPAEVLPWAQNDVLQTIVYGSLAALAMFMVIRSPAHTAVMHATMALAIMITAPFLWIHAPLQDVPTVLGYVLTTPSPFPLLPWTAYLFAGAAFAHLFFSAHDKHRLARWLVAVGLGMPFVIFARAAVAPSVFPWDAVWWECSPDTNLFRICGIVAAWSALFLAEEALQNMRPGRFLQVVGSESLFMYVSHLLIVYGPTGDYLRASLGLNAAGYGTLALCYLALTIPLLLAMWWWHTFKRAKPDHARSLLALQVLGMVLLFLLKSA